MSYLKGENMIKLLFLFLSFQIQAMDLGLKIGEKLPIKSLQATSGENISLTGKKSIFLFYRGSWCPYCVKQVKSFESTVFPKLSSNEQAFIISVDQLKVSSIMKDKFKLRSHVISDPKAKSLKAFNIINKIDDALVKKYKQSYKIDVEADSGETHHMVAHPAVFISDEQGKIIFADVHKNYKERTDNQSILKALKK